MSFYVGLDLGQAADFTALAVLELANIEEGERELHLRHLERYPLRTPYTAVAYSVVALMCKLRDRQLIELLNELRVALPGVQVLFAFLLIVPFSQGFPDVTPLQRHAYFATLLCTAVSAILLIAPSSHHRLLWRQHAKEEMLRTSNRLTIAGLAFLALAMTGAVFTITDFLFGGVLSAMVAVGIGTGFAWFWYGRPLLRLRD